MRTTRIAIATALLLIASALGVIAAAGAQDSSSGDKQILRIGWAQDPGTLNPFAGPLKNQAGVEQVAAGTTMTENEIKGMTWLVEGVQGTLPTG